MKVAIVDDSGSCIKLLSKMCNRLGENEIHDYSNGPGFLQALPLQDEPFDIIFLDVIMEPMDGFAILQTVRAIPTCKNIPVVLVTSADYNDLTVMQCQVYSKILYLEKPYNLDVLKRILNVVDSWKSPKKKFIMEDSKKTSKFPTVNRGSRCMEDAWRPPSGRTGGASDGIKYRNLTRLL